MDQALVKGPSPSIVHGLGHEIAADCIEGQHAKLDGVHARGAVAEIEGSVTGRVGDDIAGLDRTPIAGRVDPRGELEVEQDGVRRTGHRLPREIAVTVMSEELASFEGDALGLKTRSPSDAASRTRSKAGCW